MRLSALAWVLGLEACAGQLLAVDGSDASVDGSRADAVHFDARPDDSASPFDGASDARDRTDTAFVDSAEDVSPPIDTAAPGDAPTRDTLLRDAGSGCPPAMLTGFHVATTGTASGDGTEARPWDLATALSGASGRVTPGSTVWIHGGTYAGLFTISSSGTASAPVVFRGVPNERITLDGPAGTGAPVVTFANSAEHVWLWGVEITVTATTSRSTYFREGVVVSCSTCPAQEGVKIINSVIHDVQQGVTFWRYAVNGEIYGTLFYLTGSNPMDPRPRGHSIYTQNFDGTKRIRENVFWGSMGWAIHQYTETGEISGYEYRGNVSFNAGAGTAGERYSAGSDYYAAGAAPIDRFVFEDNFGYANATDRTRGNARFGSGPDGTGSIRNNLLFGVTEIHGPWDSLEVSGNRIFGALTFHGEPSHSGNTISAALPAANEIYVRPNELEPGRGHIIAYNFERRPSVTVDLSAILSTGASYEVRSVLDYYGTPVLTGRYAGGAVAIPMAARAIAQPRGADGWIVASENPSPEFDVLVVLATGC